MNLGPHFYKLIGKCPVPCSLPEYIAWAAEHRPAGIVRVAETHVGPLYVSTVFLGIDHNFWGEDPLLFETMLFDDLHDAYQCRCTTWDQAERMHAAAVVEAERRFEASKALLEKNDELDIHHPRSDLPDHRD